MLMKAVRFSDYGGPEGLFRLPGKRTFPLDRVAKAPKVSAGGHVTGKLVVCVAEVPIAS